jgi:hypothetical protein
VSLLQQTSPTPISRHPINPNMWQYQTARPGFPRARRDFPLHNRTWPRLAGVPVHASRLPRVRYSVMIKASQVKSDQIKPIPLGGNICNKRHGQVSSSRALMHATALQSREPGYEKGAYY